MGASDNTCALHHHSPRQINEHDRSINTNKGLTDDLTTLSGGAALRPLVAGSHFRMGLGQPASQSFTMSCSTGQCSALARVVANVATLVAESGRGSDGGIEGAAFSGLYKKRFGEPFKVPNSGSQKLKDNLKIIEAAGGCRLESQSRDPHPPILMVRGHEEHKVDEPEKKVGQHHMNVCRHFARGYCERGAACHFAHASSTRGGGGVGGGKFGQTSLWHAAKKPESKDISLLYQGTSSRRTSWRNASNSDTVSVSSSDSECVDASSRAVCRHWAKWGRCDRGDTCSFAHSDCPSPSARAPASKSHKSPPSPGGKHMASLAPEGRCGAPLRLPGGCGAAAGSWHFGPRQVLCAPDTCVPQADALGPEGAAAITDCVAGFMVAFDGLLGPALGASAASGKCATPSMLSVHRGRWSSGADLHFRVAFDEPRLLAACRDKAAAAAAAAAVVPPGVAWFLEKLDARPDVVLVNRSDYATNAERTWAIVAASDETNGETSGDGCYTLRCGDAGLVAPRDLVTERVFTNGEDGGCGGVAAAAAGAALLPAVHVHGMRFKRGEAVDGAKFLSFAFEPAGPEAAAVLAAAGGDRCGLPPGLRPPRAFYLSATVPAPAAAAAAAGGGGARWPRGAAAKVRLQVAIGARAGDAVFVAPACGGEEQEACAQLWLWHGGSGGGGGARVVSALDPNLTLAVVARGAAAGPVAARSRLVVAEEGRYRAKDLAAAKAGWAERTERFHEAALACLATSVGTAALPPKSAAARAAKAGETDEVGEVGEARSSGGAWDPGARRRRAIEAALAAHGFEAVAHPSQPRVGIRSVRSTPLSEPFSPPAAAAAGCCQGNPAVIRGQCSGDKCCLTHPAVLAKAQRAHAAKAAKAKAAAESDEEGGAEGTVEGSEGGGTSNLRRVLEALGAAGVAAGVDGHHACAFLGTHCNQETNSSSTYSGGGGSEALASAPFAADPVLAQREGCSGYLQLSVDDFARLLPLAPAARWPSAGGWLKAHETDGCVRMGSML